MVSFNFDLFPVQIIKKQSAPAAVPASPLNELVASARTISELTPALSLLAQQLKPNPVQQVGQDQGNQLAKVVADLLSVQVCL